MNTTIISTDRAEEIRQALSVYNAWAEQYQQKNGWTVIPADAVPPVTIDNDMRSELERYEFFTEKPASYSLYVNEQDGKAITWTGGYLGECILGRAYRDSFGGTRAPVTVIGINGIRYHGTYFKSSGDLATIKAYKNQ